jgi:hypothetical protein
MVLSDKHIGPSGNIFAGTFLLVGLIAFVTTFVYAIVQCRKESSQDELDRSLYNPKTDNFHPSCFAVFGFFVLSIVSTALTSLLMHSEDVRRDGKGDSSPAYIFAAVVLSLSIVVLVVSLSILIKWCVRKYNA